MATTITSDGGYTSSTPNDLIPEFKPSSFAEDKSFERDLLRPSIEAEKKYQEEGLKIREDNYKTIKKHAQNFEEFEPEASDEVRSRALVAGYIDTQFGDNARPSNDHGILRDAIAQHKFGGAGMGSDEAFLEAMRNDYKREDEEQSFWDELDRKATLSALMEGGEPLEEFKKSIKDDSFAKANRLEINDRWQKNREAIEEKYGSSMLFDLRTTLKELKTDDDWLSAASRRTQDYTDEEKNMFISTLRDMASAYPSEIPSTFGGNFGKGSRRGVMGALDKGSESAMEFFRNAAVGAHTTFVTPWPQVFGGESGKEWAQEHRAAGEDWLKSERDRVDFQAELRGVQENDFARIQPLAPKDSTRRAIEEGVYAIPGAITTSAIAFVPVVGMPLSFGVMKEFDRERYRNEILSNGGSRDEAYRLAGGMSMVSAVPNMLLEKFQSYGLAGRIPGMGKVFRKIDDIFANKVARFGTKMFVAGVAETAVELTQQANTDLVQDITSAYQSVVPEIEWKNGKDGHFDGYFNKTLTTFVAVAPLGVMVAGRGMSLESKAEALKTASPLERKAFGITEEASQKLDEATSPREMVEAFENAVNTREPWSETAQESVMELEAMQDMRAKTNEDAEKFGVSPAVRRTPDSPTFEVFDRTTGETIVEVDTAQEAAEEVFSQLQLKEEENAHYFQELQASFEAASLDVEQSGESVEVATGKLTDAEVELASPEAGRRLKTERELLEQRDGGTGEVAQEVMSDRNTQTIAGAYTPAGKMGRKEAVTQLYDGSSVLTLIHERGHAKRRKLMQSGAWTRADQLSALQGLDSLIAEAEERFLPYNFAELNEEKQEVAMDEAVAELAEVLALNSRKGKNSKMGNLIKKGLSSMVQARVPGAAQLSSFIKTMGQFFGLQLRRATILKKAVRDGKLDQTQVDQLTDMLVGEDTQELFEQERDAIPTQMVDGQQVDTPFSPTPLSIGNTTVTPNADTKTYPTKDGGVVGPASFSITAHHGTPHKVGKFSTEKIGTGEGVQAYGWGLYFAEALSVAKGYRDTLSKSGTDGAKRRLEKAGGNIDAALAVARERASKYKQGGADSYASAVEEDIRFLEKYRESGEWTSGSLYTVELNVEQDELLDWDKPLSEQSGLLDRLRNLILGSDIDEKLDALAEVFEESEDMPFRRSASDMIEEYMEDVYNLDIAEDLRGINENAFDDLSTLVENLDSVNPEASGSSVYSSLQTTLGDITAQKASEALAAAGIKGIRYLDGDSRADGEGTSNYVIFDDADITITEENGQVVDTSSPSFSITPADTSYRIQHQPSSDDATLNDLTEMFGEDIYGPNAAQYYGAGMTGESEVLDIFKKVRGNPEAKVRIYRVVPAFADQINPGDWVTISKAAADEMNNSEFLGGDSSGNPQESKIISKVVTAKEVTWPGDSMQEQGYFPSSPSFSPGDARMLSNITPAQDAEYADLAKNPEKNRSALQKLVDAAAKAAGYTVGPVYHGSKSPDVKEFDPGKHSFPRSLDAIGTWFTTEESQTKRYAGEATTYRQFLKMDNPLTFELKNVSPEMHEGDLRKLATRRGLLDQVATQADNAKGVEEQKETEEFYQQFRADLDKIDARVKENEPSYRLMETWQEFHGGEQFGDVQAFVAHLKSLGYDGVLLKNNFADYGLEGASYADWYIAFDSNQSKSADPITKDADGNVIPLSQRFDASRGEIAFSPGDARMLSDLSENVMRRVRAPESRAVVFEQLVDRIDALKRDVAKLIFGGTVVQEAIPEDRSMKSLKKEAAFRQAARHEELEMKLDSEMRTLGADLDVSVQDMPVHSALIDGGYKLITKKRALKEGRMSETDGDFDDAGGLHPSVFGGDTMPDVAAQALSGLQQDGQVLLQEGTVSELYDALAQEWQQVQENRQSNKEAKRKIREAKKQAKTEADEWLKEEVAKQKKHYNPVARIRRSLVMYDALLKTLPPELRGKMGGFVQISKLNTDKARLDFLEKKVDQLDVEVDKWISGKHRKQIERIFEANRPKKKPSGVSKVDSDAMYADQVIEIEQISEMTQEQIDEEIEGIDGDIETAKDEWTLEDLVERRDKLSIFGNIAGMKANALGDFYQNLNTIHRQGKLLKSITDAQFNQFLGETIDIVNEDVTGGQGQITQSEAKRKDDARTKKKINLKWIGAESVEIDGLADFHRKNLSFEWLLNAISRANKAVETMKSKTNQRLGTMVHLATTASDRGEMRLLEEYREAMGDIFGIRAGGPLNVLPALENKITEMEKVQETNIFKMEYEGDGKSVTRTIPMSKVQAIIDDKATLDGLGLSPADWSAIKESHAEMIKQKQAKEDEKAKAAKRTPKKVSLTASAKITYEAPMTGESKRMALSQSQAINLTMLWRQKGLQESMRHEGYSDKTMEEMENFLTEESKQIRDWLTIKYEENYNEINKVFRVQNGFSLPKIDFYSPAVRMAQKEAKDMSIDSQGRQAMSVSPEFTITRTKNRAPMDQNAGALSIYMSHALQTNHYVSWADTVKVLRSVFANKDVRANIKGYVGASALSTIEERIQWFADGGNRKATHIKLMDSLRAAHTYSSLAFKWSILLKQLTSLPAYAFDMGFKDFSKYGMKFLKHPIRNLRAMSKTEYVRTRFKKGYERDVIDGLRNRGKASFFRKALQLGMMSGKVGDIIPVMIGGWIAREQAYDAARAEGLSEADAKRKAEITFEMVSDRSQQAGGLKDLSSFQGEGSIFKLFTMYKTSPRQYYANVYESLLDAGGVKGLVKGDGKKGSRTQFTRRFLISHVMLPITFQFVSDATRMGLRPDDEDAFKWESYLRAMLLGPLNGVFILGDMVDLISSAVAGTHMWEKVIPVLGGTTEVAKGIYELGDGDFADAADEIARGIGKMTPSALTFYDLLTDEARRLRITE